jgi:hypothetical protein
MAVAFYMDAHIPRAVTLGLRLRGLDVITAQEDGSATSPDPELLDRATALDRILFSFDDDLLAEAERRQQEGIRFSGVVYAHPLRVSIGACVHDFEVIAKTTEAEDWVNQVMFLPL